MGRNVKRLPASYSKAEGSNNDKILKLNELAADEFSSDTADVDETMDISRASGQTLNLYGEMLGQKRGQLNDAQYRYMINVRIAQLIGKGDIQSTVTLLALILQCEQQYIDIYEDYPAKVGIRDIPLTLLIEVGYTAGQVMTLINTILPAGVSISEANFSGTFEFSDLEYEYDANAGFADDDGTIGGYLGFAIGDESVDFELPVV